jgi:CheY-like chemotaxis protein
MNAVMNDDGTFALTIEVTDTGIGIPPAKLEELFESFSQVDASTTRTHGGTGLGLAISKSLAEAMGGSLTATSELGKGSRFTLQVTLTQCPDWAKVQARDAVAAAALAGRSALIVDDNDTNLHILQLQCDRLGMESTVAKSAEEALQLIEQGLTFDVALLDAHMPEADGSELAAKLKQSAQQVRTAPRVLLSSRGWSTAAEGEDLFTTVLSKPVKMTGLRDTLTALFTGASLPAEPESIPPSAPEPSAEPKRVLVAEDNPVNQRVAQLMLSKLGHKVDIVGDGASAVRATEVSSYDVILMDVQMPQMDGLEATRRIRANSRNGRQPHIVAMTASALVEDREACAEAGMEAYLTKPVRAWELKAVLDQSSIPSGERSARPAVAVQEWPTAVAVHSEDAGPIDLDIWRDLTTHLGDESHVRADVVASYVRLSRGLAARLSRAAATSDVPTLIQTAEDLASSSATLGATVLADMCNRLIETAREHPDAIQQPVVDIMSAYERACGSLRALASAVDPGTVNGAAKV